ncbi:hypothetical protein EBU95_03860 [bacterium]|nr:hypothetical protein [bacterium]
MDHIVFYVKKCTPKVKKFKVFKQANLFYKKLLKKTDEDNWVDCLITGKVISISDQANHLLKDLKNYGDAKKTKTNK